MKFQKLLMKNFMRYKGVNEINFSCREKENVTVILGDNTSGKTTIAQAFRFVLYGGIELEKGSKQKDYFLLNHDVLSSMDGNSHADAEVIIEFLNDNRKYRLLRSITYARNFPEYSARQLYSKSQLSVSDKEECEEGDFVQIEETKIDEVILEMFPKDLSQYFLFDGERWKDSNLSGMKENIKESVHKLTGLFAVKSAMYHLKDMGRNSVIQKFKSNIEGSGAIYDSLTGDKDREERRKSGLEEKLLAAERNMEYYQVQIDEIEDELESNQSAIALQERYKNLERMLQSREETLLRSYRTLIQEFSDKAHFSFAAPMREAAVELLKTEKVNRRDIPFMKQTTIDYLINRGECICGCPVPEGSIAYTQLIKQRRYLPPADIGSILGEFEMEARKEDKAAERFNSDIPVSADITEKSKKEYEEIYNEYYKLGEKMDTSYEFGERRRELKNLKNKLKEAEREYGIYEGQIEQSMRTIGKIERELESCEAKTLKNKKWKERVLAAEEIYNRLQSDFKKKEIEIFQDINTNIDLNFKQMFNAKDKKVELDKNYNIKFYYKTDRGLSEEMNLSEGEKIARNFAFIVTIMEYGKRKRKEGEEIDLLPIVLDGPFSKLGEENIALTAAVLPQIAEQVIIFMLEKDWKYTKLDPYVGAQYRIEKQQEKNSARIVKLEGESSAGTL